MHKMLPFLLAFLLSFNLYAKEIAGLNIPSKRTFDTFELSIKGSGIRDKFFMDLYVASLYLSYQHESAKEILLAKEPMAFEIVILSSLITSEKMEEATKEGFANSVGEQRALLQERIDRFIALFKEPITIHDRYLFLYTPQAGTRIYKNETLKTTIQGDDFKEALWGIWLGAKPAQESLKKSLLGK